MKPVFDLQFLFFAILLGSLRSPHVCKRHLYLPSNLPILCTAPDDPTHLQRLRLHCHCLPKPPRHRQRLKLPSHFQPRQPVPCNYSSQPSFLPKERNIAHRFIQLPGHSRLLTISISLLPLPPTYPGDPIWDYRYGGIFFGPDVIHTGIDLPAPRGAEVLAAGPGTVVWAGIGLYSGSKYNLKDPYGLAVAIRHDFGYKDQPLYTVYAHMEEVDVIVGQWVNTGDVVGHVGDTGMTTGPHLHFEVRLGENDFWKTRNPELWISPPQGYGVLVGRVMSTYGEQLDSYLVLLKSLDTEKQYSVKTYGPLTVNSDAYYNENVVLGDLPAGVYELNIPYGALNRKVNIQILPGQITYFSFYGYRRLRLHTACHIQTPVSLELLTYRTSVLYSTQFKDREEYYGSQI